jgi:hypothetical protein
MNSAVSHPASNADELSTDQPRELSRTEVFAMQQRGFGSDRLAAVPAAAQAVEAPAAAPTEALAAGNSLSVDDEAEGIRSYIADGDVIEGNLLLKSGLRIAGRITGRVLSESGSVIVEKTGVVDGGIEANGRIIVDGQVGDPEKSECTDQSAPAIRTPGLFAVLGEGKVYGCYQYGRIATYDDATVEGMGKKLRG